MTYGLGGPDADLFDISGDGEVTFLTPPDFENPRDVGRDNIYVMTVEAASGEGARRLTATAELRIRVRDAAEPPEFSGPDAFEVAENGTEAGTVQASDPDDGEQVTGYTLGGADADLFGITADGALSFLTAPNFEAPLGGTANDSNVYEVAVTATGGADGKSASRDYRVTVTDMDDEAPGAPAPEVSAVTETAFEVAWEAPDNAGPPVEGYEVGYRRGYDGAFTDAGHTGTGTSQRIGNLEPGAAYQVQVRARNAEGTGPWSAPVTAITTANDPPAFAAGAVAPVHAAEVAENAVQVVEVTAADPDPDDPVTYGVGGADANRFEVAESGGAQWLVFKAAPDFESPGSAAGTNVYAVTVTATGGSGARAQSVAADVTVTVTDAPEPPVFSGPETFEVAENTRQAGTVQASDPDTGERVTGYTLGGADAARFEITDAGALSFVDAPDFERPRGVPAGATNTNVYSVTVTAASGADGMTAARDVTVTVTDALEPPGVPAAPTFGAATGTSLAVSWTAPANTGPPIEDYDLEYREAGTSGAFADAGHAGPATTRLVTGLTGRAYEFRVRARSDEGTGGWSDPGTASVADNALPAFALGLAPAFDASVRENALRVVEVTASDPDAGDAVTGYTLGGADRDRFEIVRDGDERWLAFRAAPDFERPRGAPAGAANPNVYEVTVTVTGGDGARARSVTAAGRVTVTDADEAPVFSGAALFEVAENATDVGTVQASDPDAGDSVTGYSVSGTDAARFEISTAGVLSFATAPDFENPRGRPARATNTNTYEVTVTATGGATALTAQRRYRVTVTDTDEPPRAPPALRFPSVGTTSLAVEWTAPAGPDRPPVASYDLQYRATRTGPFTAGPQGVTGTRATLTGLMPGTLHEVQVRARSAEGAGAWSDSGAATTGANRPPAFRLDLAPSHSAELPENRARAVEVTAADPDPADTVAWALTGRDAARFEVEEDGGTRWLVFLAPPDFERPGSVASTNTYEVTVTASSGDGERALSVASDLVIAIADAPEPPAFSGAAAFEVAENTTAAGTVQAADPDTGDAVTGYTVGGPDAALFEIGDDGALAFLRAPDFEAPRGSAGVDSNTYRLSVTATGGADALSAARDYAVTVTDVLEPPGRPAAPAVTGSTRTSLTVEWRAPANAGPPIQDYDLQYRVKNIGSFLDGPQDVADTRVTVEELAPDTEYEVRVRANSAEGEGRWSAPATATTGVDAPPAFESALLAAGLALAIPENERAVVAVTATDPDPSDAVTYRLTGANAGLFEIADVGGTPWLRFATAPDFEAPQGGANGDSNTYEVTVAATGGSGARALTVTADVAVTVTDLDLRPAAPPAPTLVAAASTSLEVSWEAPANPGPPIVEYIAEIRRLPSGSWERFDEGGTRRTYTIESLTPGATYQVRVRARNAEGTGPWSQRLAAITGDVPGEPSRPTFSGVTAGRMTAHWEPPSHTGGSPILKYEYEVKYVQFNYVFEEDETTGTSLPLAVARDNAAMASTVTYGVRVRAQNANDWGPWSVEGRQSFARPVGGRNNRQPSFTRDTVIERVSVRSGVTAVGNARTASATDPDPEDDTVSYILRTKDAHLFSISADGMLSFRTAPDFESPADGNRDNVYRFFVTALGGTGSRQLARDKDMFVTVRPNRPPAFSESDAFSVAENVTEAGRVRASDPDSGDGVTFALGGADADLFTIANNGTLSFTNPPDFETPGSAAGTNVYELTVTVTGGRGAHALSVDRPYTVTVTDENEPPAFLGPETAFSVEENVAAAGSAAAADPDPGDTVSYELGGADAALFDVAADGALSFRSAPDFETPRGGPDDLSNVYQVTVTATGGNGARATTAARDHEVTVTDALEPPSAPAPPAFGTRTGATLAVRWAAPENAGPPIEDYDVQYRAAGGGAFTDAGHDGTATTATLAGLTPGSAYEVQVRASNDEDTGPWSSSATAPAAANAPPVFDGAGTPIVLDFAENGTAAAGTVTARDPDAGDTVTYTLGGADAGRFDIAADGAITFVSPPDFERPRGNPVSATNTNAYEVAVTATGGQGARALTATAAVTVRVTDELEPPSAPAAPSVAAGSARELAVEWQAPANAGPAVEDYDVRYRLAGGGDGTPFTDAPHEGPGTTASIASLLPDTAYEVQVLARSEEGVSAWSASGTGRTAPAAPAVSGVAVQAPANGGTFVLGETISMEVRFDEPVTVTGAPALTLAIGAVERAAPFSRADGPDRAVFAYAVQAGDHDPDGIAIAADALRLPGGASIRDADGNDADPDLGAHAFGDDPGLKVDGRPNAPPVFLGGAAFIVAENLAGAGTVRAADPDAADRVTGYTLGGVDADLFEIAESGALAFVDAPNFEVPLGGADDDANVYELTVTAASGEGLRARSAERDYRVTVTDVGDERPGAPAAPTFGVRTATTMEVEWTAPDNPGPPISDYDVQYREAGAVGAFTDANHEGAGTTVTLAGLSRGLSYEVQVRARNTDGEGAWSALATASTAANEAPAFGLDLAPSHAVELAENATQVVDVSAEDPDAGDAVSYTLGGADAAVFEIAEVSGQAWLVFSRAPDFERPRGMEASATNTNTYAVTVTAAGGDGGRRLTVSADVTVTVTDVDEPPAFSGPAAFEAAENQTLAGAVVAADPDAGAVVTWDLTGPDAARFRITGTGLLRFLAAPDFERPRGMEASATNTNVYELTVTATSGAASVARDYTVTVTNVIERPEKPAPPTLVRATATSLEFEWQPPASAGPPVGDYDVNYRRADMPDTILEKGQGGATRVVIDGLEPDTAYEVRVRVDNGEGDTEGNNSDEGESEWSDWTRAVTGENAPPAFASGSYAFDVPENAPPRSYDVTATDPDSGDDVTYALSGPDEARFRLVDIPGGQVGLQNRQAFDFEDPQGGANGDSNTYEVTVAATGGDGLRARTVTQDVRVRVTDVDEAPSAPAAPTFGTVTNTSLEVTWQPRDNTGRPPIEGYDLQYRRRNIGSFLPGPQDVAEARATIADLAPETEYEVRVRAENHEGESAWSGAARARTGADAAPVFSGPAAFIVVENVARAGPVTAADPDPSDRITGYATGGPDGALFEVRDENGAPALFFKSAPDFETPLGGAADDANTYEVTVTATGGAGARETTAAQEYRVTVTDAREPPAAPAAPVLTAGSTALTVAWAAPANTGPAIEGYDLRYREAGAGAGWTAGPQDVTATSVEIAALAPDTAYEVQVRAEHDEGAGAWSGSATATTTGNRPPAFVVGEISPSFAATLAENVRRVIAVIATDPDLGDTVTYALSGADENLFETETDGVTVWLAFRDPPDFENPRGGAGGGSNTYRVTVAATGGIGERAMTVTADATVTVVDEAEAPVFTGDAAFEVPENRRPAGTVTAEDQDAGERLTGYALGGTDAGRFEITDAGALSFVEAPDFERPRGMPESPTNTNVYELTVTATGGTDTSMTSASRDYTVTVTNVIERPDKPAPPTLVRATATSLEFEWRAPDRAGGPPVGDYDVQYRRADTPDMTPIPQGQGGATRTVIVNSEDTPLEPDTAYEVQVRVDNGEGDTEGNNSDLGESDWSDWSQPAVTAANSPPVRDDGFVTVDEKVRRVAPIVATDPDPEDSVTYGLGGPDADLFEFQDVNGTNTLFFKSAPDFENPLDVGGDAVGDNVYVVIVEVASGAGARRLTATAEIEVVVRDVDEPPQFAGSAEFEVAENATVAGQVQASDPETGEGVTFEVQGGADQARFEIAADGALSFKSPPDFERPRGVPVSATNTNVYEVTVRIESTDPFHRSPVDRAYRVMVTDEDDEAPGTPAAPAVAAVTGTSLEVTWAAPANAGPPIEDYDVRWRVHGADGAWEELDDATPSTALTATLTRLLPNTPWEVQVRAENDEGTGAWSASGVLDANVPPVFSGGAAFIVAENVVAAGTVRAADPDADDRVTGYTLGGADAGLFEISDAGALAFLVAPDFERPRGLPVSPTNPNAYEVTVTATGGSEARALEAERDYTVTVTDATEPPGAPAAPTFGTATETGLVVNWTAPANAGPPIEGYDLQYREAGTAGSFLAGPQDVSGLSAALAGLTPGTGYEVQVRAENDEGAGAWSQSATATTVVNAPPSLALPGTGSLPVDVQENVRRVRAVVATDPDAGDAVSYGLTGADADLFEFQDESGSNTLFFKSAPDFEDPRGGAANDSNAYEVTVAATSGDGARALTVERQLVVTVTDAPEPPAFEGPETFEVAENVADAGTVTAADPDAGESVTGYTLGGADAGRFAIGADGALAFLVAPDFERPRGVAVSPTNTNDYELTVTATGGADGLTAARDYTVTVTNVIERPEKPAPPTLVRATATSLEFEWRAPDRAGGPPVGDYDVQYRRADMPDMIPVWHGHGGTPRVVIGGLDPDTAYEVRVRGENGEGDLPGRPSSENDEGGERLVGLVAARPHRGQRSPGLRARGSRPGLRSRGAGEPRGRGGGAGVGPGRGRRRDLSGDRRGRGAVRDRGRGRRALAALCERARFRGPAGHADERHQHQRLRGDGHRHRRRGRAGFARGAGLDGDGDGRGGAAGRSGRPDLQ